MISLILINQLVKTFSFYGQILSKSNQGRRAKCAVWEFSSMVLNNGGI